MMLTGKKDEAKALFVAEIDTLKADAYRAGALAAICDVSFGKAAWQDVISWGGKLQAAKPTPEQAARGHYQQGYAHYQLKKPVEAIASLCFRLIESFIGCTHDDFWVRLGYRDNASNSQTDGNCRTSYW